MVEAAVPRRRVLLFPNAEDGSCGPDQIVGKERMPFNGHCTYLSDNSWVLNDTYPQADERLQDLYLYHVPSDRRVDLGRFHAPSAYWDTLRCDLHPRSSPDGSKIVIDSTHGGRGRQMYLCEVGEVVGA